MVRHDPVLKMAVGFTSCPEFVSGAIRLITREAINPFSPMAFCSHTLNLYEHRSQRRHYEEALMSEGWTAKEFPNLHSWAQGRHRLCLLCWLPLLETEADAIAVLTAGWIGKRLGYSTTAIFAQLFGNSVIARKWGLGIVRDADPTRVICSEGTSESVEETVPRFKLRDEAHPVYASISPQVLFDKLCALTIAGTIELDAWEWVSAPGGNCPTWLKEVGKNTKRKRGRYAVSQA